MKKAGPAKRHRDDAAEPSQSAVVEVEDSTRRPPGQLSVGIGASAGGLLAIKGGIECASLAVNIRGGNSDPVAYLMLKRGCPFVLTTGGSDWPSQIHFSGEKRPTKLYSKRNLEKNLHSLIDQAALIGNTGPGSKS
jgi:hypothetical protein